MTGGKIPTDRSLLDVLAAVSDAFGVSVPLIVGAPRTKPVVRARQASMLLCFELLGASWCQIGRVLARDHTTVMHGIGTAQRRRAGDADYAGRIAKAAMLFDADVRAQVRRVA